MTVSMRVLAFVIVAVLFTPAVSYAQCYYELSVYGEFHDDQETEQVYIFASGSDQSQCSGECYHEYQAMTWAEYSQEGGPSYSYQVQNPPDESPTLVFGAQVDGIVNWGVMIGVWCSCFQNWVANAADQGQDLVQRSCVPDLQSNFQDYHQWMFSDDHLSWSGPIMNDVIDAASAWTGYIQSWTPAIAFSHVPYTDTDLKVFLYGPFWGTNTYGAAAGHFKIYLSPEAWAFPPNFALSNAMHEFGHTLGYGHKPTRCYNETIMATGDPRNNRWPTGFGGADNVAMERDIP